MNRLSVFLERQKTKKTIHFHRSNNTIHKPQKTYGIAYVTIEFSQH